MARIGAIHVGIIDIDRKLLAAALRVLTGRLDGRRTAIEDVDFLREHAISREMDYELEDLACSIVQRLTYANRLPKQSVMPAG